VKTRSDPCTPDAPALTSRFGLSWCVLITTVSKTSNSVGKAIKPRKTGTAVCQMLDLQAAEIRTGVRLPISSLEGPADGALTE